MSESRDANDPRDLMRRLRKEEEAAFEREEASDTGGQEHASREDREGEPPGRRPAPRSPTTAGGEPAGAPPPARGTAPGRK